MLTASLTIGSTNLVELTGLQDTTNNSYPGDATVAGVLTDPKGTAVTGADAIAMALVAGTSGADTIYRGSIPASAPLVEGKVYNLTVTATDTSGNKRVFTASCTAVKG